jgi:hypothetical protein
VTTGRGNLSFTTINLPRLGIKAERNMKTFYRLLDEVTELTINQLYHRFQVQCRLKVKDLPFVMGQGMYLGSEDLKPDDSIEPAIVNGTLTVGFIDCELPEKEDRRGLRAVQPQLYPVGHAGRGNVRSLRQAGSQGVWDYPGNHQPGILHQLLPYTGAFSDQQF